MFSVQAIEFENESMLLAIWDINRIYRLNLYTQAISLICNERDIDKSVCVPYGQVHKYSDNKYLFAPLRTNEILIYDAELNKCKNIMLRDNPYAQSEKDVSNFIEIVPNGKYLFLIPVMYPAVIRFDCETEEIEYIYQGISELIQNRKNNNEMFHRGYAVIGDYIYLTSICCKDKVVRIDTNTLEVVMLTLDYETIAICGNDKNENALMMTKKGGLLKWNTSTGDIRVEIDESKEVDMPFYEMLLHGEKIICLPWRSNQVVIYDLVTQDRKTIEFKGTKEALALCGKVKGEILYTFLHGIRKLVKINIITGELMDEIEIKSPVDDEVYYYEGVYESENKLYREIDEKSLEQFIKSI